MVSAAVHTVLIAAAAPHPSLHGSVRLQIAQIAAAGNAAEKALLADLTAKNPVTSYVERLRLFKVPRKGPRSARCIRCMLHRVWLTHIGSQLPHLTWALATCISARGILGLCTAVGGGGRGLGR